MVRSQQKSVCSGRAVGCVELARRTVDTEKPSGIVTTVIGEEIFMSRANASSCVTRSGITGLEANSAGDNVKNLILPNAGPSTF